jgi:hypothetical protein
MVRLLAGVFLLLLLASPAAHGQGERLAVEAKHLTAVEAERFAAVARSALIEAEQRLRHQARGPVRVVLVRTAGDLDPDVRSSFEPWTVALARLDRGDVHCVGDRIGGEPANDLYSVLLHEMVHVVLGDLERLLAGGQRRLPRWLHEGLAQDLAGSFLLGGDESAVEFAARTDRLVPWGELADGFPRDTGEARAAYAQSASFLAFLRRTIGFDPIRRAIDSYLRGDAESLDVALDRQGFGSFTLRTADWIIDLKSPWRVVASLGRSCSSVVLVLAIPLLGLVLYKRFRREKRALARLEAWEAEQDAAAAADDRPT